MSSTRHIISLTAAIAAVLVAACSSEAPLAPTPNAPSFARSGTAAGGGGVGGGVDTTTARGGASGRTTPSGLIGSSFTGRVDSISNVPMTTYYAAPSTWGVGGYVFQSTWLTRVKDTAAPYAVGGCLTVTFATSSTGAYIASDIRTEVSSKCP